VEIRHRHSQVSLLQFRYILHHNLTKPTLS
jgi:hypothetical protein